MSACTTKNPTVVRTERGLTVAGTRITLYDVMDYLTAGWPAGQICDRLKLSAEQIADVTEYIQEHRAEVEAEYQRVLQLAAENRQYWEGRNRDRLDRSEVASRAPGHDEIRAKLRAWKDRLGRSE